MEEKERYELFGEHCIKDNNPDARPQLLDAYVACVILNEQDKENQQLKKQLADKEQENEHLKEEICKYEITLMDKNSQLKQSQKELEISELEKLKDFFLEPYGDEKMGTEFLITTKNTGKIAEYVLDRIKSLKGE